MCLCSQVLAFACARTRIIFFDLVDPSVSSCLGSRFNTQINMGCVDQSGELKTAWPPLGNWRRDFTIEYLLLQLRQEMSSSPNRRLPQPAEGANYFRRRHVTDSAELSGSAGGRDRSCRCWRQTSGRIVCQRRPVPTYHCANLLTRAERIWRSLLSAPALVSSSCAESLWYGSFSISDQAGHHFTELCRKGSTLRAQKNIHANIFRSTALCIVNGVRRNEGTCARMTFGSRGMRPSMAMHLRPLGVCSGGSP